MSGISKKRFRRPTAPGRWGFGGAAMPKPITDALGIIVCEWGFLEQQMDSLLTAVIGSPVLSKVIRREVRTVKQRQSLLKALVEASAATDLKPEILHLMGRYNALLAERGLYVHGVWGSHTGHPDEALLMMDDAIIDIAHVTLDDVITGNHPLVTDRTFELVALVSIRDLTRFQEAMSSLTSQVSEIVATVMFSNMKAVMDKAQTIQESRSSTK